jgi:hypothetical protein
MTNSVVSNPTVLLIGGPDAGKSNYLFRAWTQIDSGTGLLEKNGLPPDVEYLRLGAQSQLRGEYSSHTSQDVHVISRIPVRLRGDSPSSADLSVPDVNGEKINSIYKARRWDNDWESLIRDSTSYLFFVRANSDQTIAPLDWIACYKLYGGVPEAPPEATASATGNGDTKSVDRNIVTPTQVVLVDWLQFILKAVRDKYSHTVRPRVGIIVTAWDSVPPEPQANPSAWIQENLPLLYQFAASNHDAFVFSYFGTSVFDGDPVSDPDFATELSNKDPRKLGSVQHSLDEHPQTTSDFALPIAWALGWYPKP